MLHLKQDSYISNKITYCWGGLMVLGVFFQIVKHGPYFCSLVESGVIPWDVEGELIL